MMKRIAGPINSACLLAVLIAGLFVLAGCSDRPEDAEVTTLIESSLSDRVPGSWVDYFLGGSDAKLESIEIEQWGEQHSDGSWPVTVHVVGTAKVVPFIRPREWREFDRVAVYIVYKDDSREWQVRYQEPPE